MRKKFTLNTEDYWIGGVCGGLSDFFNIDSLYIRLLFILAAFLFPQTFFIYILIWFLASSDNTEN